MKYFSLSLFISGFLWFFSIMILNFKFFPDKRNINFIVSVSRISDYRNVIQSELDSGKKRQLKIILSIAIILTVNFFFQFIHFLWF